MFCFVSSEAAIQSPPFPARPGRILLLSRHPGAGAAELRKREYLKHSVIKISAG